MSRQKRSWRGAMKERVQLRDGTNAVIHPYVPVSREAIEEAYSELSEETQFARFLTAAPHFTDEMYEHLVEDIDGVDHIVLVLAIKPDKGPDSIIGVARIVRYPEEPTDADVAVTIRDEWHGVGAATALLEVLMRQRPEGVTRIVTVVAADNEASLAMLRRLGDTHVTPTDHETLKVVVDLPESPEQDNAPSVEADAGNT